MEDKINKERKAKIWREQRLEEERQKLKDLERKRKEKRIPERRGRGG